MCVCVCVCLFLMGTIFGGWLPLFDIGIFRRVLFRAGCLWLRAEDGYALCLFGSTLFVWFKGKPKRTPSILRVPEKQDLVGI